jgi:hypothetical protein
MTPLAGIEMLQTEAPAPCQAEPPTSDALHWPPKAATP